MTKERQSNIELLRIVAMFMVMILHVNLGLGVPSQEDALTQPLSTLSRLFFELFSIGSVNAFVLISGWFGIKPSIKRLSSFVFQCIFITWGVFIVMMISGLSPFNLKSLDENIFVRSWFIQAYLILYLVSPALNYVVEHNKKTHIYMLIGLMAMEFIYDTCAMDRVFGGGYSALHFIILYLLAGYVRKYGIWSIIEKYAFVWFLVVVILFTGFRFWLVSHGYPQIHRLGQYSSPIIIFTGLCLLLGFKRIKIQSRFVNWVAASSFAVYLLHTNPLILVPYYIKFANSIFANHSGVAYLGLVFLYMIAWFAVSVLIDQIRIICWKKLCPVIFKQNGTD